MSTMRFTYRPPKGLLSPETRFVESAPLLKLKPVPSATTPKPAVAPKPALEPDFNLDDSSKIDRWWYESSYDLRTGLEVTHDNTVPGELLDELFKLRPHR